MEPNNNFEKFDKFFKESLEGAESNPPADLWQGIESQINSPVSSNPQVSDGGASLSSSVLTKLTSLKGILAISTVAAALVGAVLVSEFKADSGGKKQEVEVNLSPIEITEENSPLSSTEAGNEPGLEAHGTREDLTPNSPDGQSAPTGIATPPLMKKDVMVDKSPSSHTLMDQAMPRSEQREDRAVSNISDYDKKQAGEVDMFFLSDSIICKGGEVAFSVKGPFQFANAKYIWEFGDGTRREGLGKISHIYKREGNYIVSLSVVTPEAIHVSRKSVSVQAVKARFAVQDLGEGKFSFQSQSVGAEKLLWNFGENDGFVYGPSSQIHKYFDYNRSKYQVSLVALNRNQCSDTFRLTVHNPHVSGKQNPFIPNVFTPDHDGVNDKFEILIENEVSYGLVISNRRGERVFESNDKNKLWDGLNMQTGKPCENGSYFYVFTYQLQGGQVKRQFGDLQLIRP